jgi:Xaa-Pro aminopeptidase
VSVQFRVPADEIAGRTQQIQNRLQENGIDALLVVQRVDLFYFSGTAQSGWLFMPAKGEPVLFVKRYYPRARAESPLAEIVEVRSITELPELIHDHFGTRKSVVGLEYDVLPVREYEYYQSLFPHWRFVDASAHILDVRAVKSEWEIEQMRHTAELSHKTFAYMQEILQPGLTEMEFAGLTEAHARKLGHAGRIRVRHFLTEAYTWHVLSGRTGGMPGMLDAPSSGEGTSPAFPCGAGFKPLEENEPIMVDFAFMHNGFHMDETRMFALGRMPDKALRTTQAAIEIHQAICEKAVPGMTTGELFNYSLLVADNLGYTDTYLGPPGRKVSFVGHGIGHELVEPPFIARHKKTRLKPGMTFAIEPKLVFEGEFSAGVESVFVVTDTGLEMLSRIPLQVIRCG